MNFYTIQDRLLGKRNLKASPTRTNEKVHRLSPFQNFNIVWRPEKGQNMSIAQMDLSLTPSYSFRGSKLITSYATLLSKYNGFET